MNVVYRHMTDTGIEQCRVRWIWSSTAAAEKKTTWFGDLETLKSIMINPTLLTR